MAIMIVKHKVKDFTQWKPVFDSLEALRRQHGWIGHEVYREPTDLNSVVIVNRMGSVEQAKAYGASPELHEAMKNGGVITQPEITILSDAEMKVY